MVKRALLSVCLVCFGFASAQNTDFQAGKVIPRVACIADAKQTYALYLPTRFTTSRAWPIIYMFDPLARGESAVQVVQAAAEKYGYIVVASNNSKNGPTGGSAQAAQAIWQDTHQRFPIDPKRQYFAGMSGGARVATSIAVQCGGCAAGVIANAAGFPVSTPPPHDARFAYFAAVGNADFNYAEFVRLRPQLQQSGIPYMIREFDGPHGWAPAELWDEALNWMDLQAMAIGTLPRDASRIQATLDQDMTRAKDFEARNDLLQAYREYQSVIRNLHALADVSAAQARVTELEKAKPLKDAEKQENSDIEQQQRIESGPSEQMEKIASGELESSEFAALRASLMDLKRESTLPGNSSLIKKRALSGLVVQAFEAGQRSSEQKQYLDALRYFELAAAGSENPAWAYYERAKVFALKSEKKSMLSELRQCLIAGVRNPAALDAEEFERYRGQAEFEAVREQWKKQAERAAPKP